MSHIRLTSHVDPHAPKPPAIRWGAPDPAGRGPVVATLTLPEQRNAIGIHAGAYGVYRAMAVARGELDPLYRADLTDTSPTLQIGPHPQWGDPERIVSLDPWGAMTGEAFADWIERGYDVRPTIAVAQARIHLPELAEAIEAGRVEPDGDLLHRRGVVSVTKAAIEPVWHLPGIAARFEVDEAQLRRHLFEQTGGMYPELVTRSDLQVFLPPIGGHTVYLFGDSATIPDPAAPLAVRVHDECNGSDVFGSDICTCRPYLIHGVEACIRTALAGGAGVIVYNRKEGRALGEVTKFLVYNARKRQAGGDRADAYFSRTECIAGVQDARFQELMPDVLHWLGVSRIHELLSMSNLKHEAIVSSGISVDRRSSLPPELVPEDAWVELDAKVAAGYYSEGGLLEPDGPDQPRAPTLEPPAL